MSPSDLDKHWASGTGCRKAWSAAKSCNVDSKPLSFKRCWTISLFFAKMSTPVSNKVKPRLKR